MKICFIGGDRRMLYAARRMSLLCPVFTYGLPQGAEHPVTSLHSALTEADAVIFPLPATRDGIHPIFSADSGLPPPEFAEIFAGARASTRFFAGKPPKRLADTAARHGFALEDYYGSERLLRLTAEATAEAALAMAVEALPVTLAGCTVAIVGFGRIGRALARLLVACGARVCVYARTREAREDAIRAGCTVLPCVSGERFAPLPDLRAVFHTAPAPLWDKEALAGLPRTCLLLDLAGGALDAAAADAYGILHPNALALPGRFSPESAGGWLFEEIFARLAPEGVIAP